MELTKTWTELKDLISSKKLRLQYEEMNDTPARYFLFAIESNITYNCKILKNTSDATDFETNYKSNCNKPIVNKDSYGNSEFMPVFRTGSKTNYVSYDFSKRQTWWQTATKVLSETLTDSGDHLTYNFAHPYIISANDISDADEIYESNLLDSNVMQYDKTFLYKFYKIYVDDVLTNTGYSINFVSGTITFTSSQAGKTIKADYYYSPNSEGTSKYTVTPTSGKILRLIRAEAQFSEGTTFNDAIVFKVKVGSYVAYSKSYKNAKDILNEANLAYMSKPFGELTKEIIVMPWDYPVTIDLKSSLNMALEVSLANDQPFTNSELVCVTFYFAVENE